MRIYDWIVIVIFIILLGWGVVVNIKYLTLQVDYEKLKNTKTKEIVKSYTPLELKKNTYKIHIPQVNIEEYVFVKVDSIVFKDSIKYVPLPREYYYTKQDDVEIWHSGIDSRIDSLRYKTRETVITETQKKKDWKHEINIYCSAGYDNKLRLPIGAEYTYYPKRWIGVGTKLEHDVFNHTTGLYVKANIRFGW